MTKPFYRLSAKQTGFILIVLSLILLLVFLSSTYQIIKAKDSACKELCGLEKELSCPHAGSLPLQSYIGFSIVFVLAGIGLFMSLSGKKYQEELTKKEKELEKTIAKLKKDERKICELIKENEGAIFQSELVEKTNFSKVKISRLLDKLEGKGLIERRRRGMTNLVLLKSNF